MTEEILCTSCGSPGGYHPGQLCLRCDAATRNEKCGKCGSPWIYIHALMREDKPRVPLCKPCCYAYIKLCGYLDDTEAIYQRMKDRHEAEKAKEAYKPESEVKPTPRRGENQPGML